MNRRCISSGSPFEERFAYSRAVALGDWCFVAGCTGYDPATGRLPAPAAEQAQAALATARAALVEAGFGLEDVVRVQYTIADATYQEEIAPSLREAFADVRPAATMVVAGLVSPDMKVEIEVTAYRPSA